MDDIVGVFFLLPAGQGVDCWPLLAVLAEFKYYFAAQDACVMLERVVGDSRGEQTSGAGDDC